MILRRIGNEIKVAAPAKLNLFLEVLARRTDGYHEVETAMVAIDRFDSVWCGLLADNQIVVDCGWAPGLAARQSKAATVAYEPLPAAAENLVAKALSRFREQTGVRTGISCRITKRIPAAAGLGGASSDAAAALVAVNELCGHPLSEIELEQFAGTLGSDIPFFVRSQRAVIARGRGEHVQSCIGPAILPLVIVRPPEGLSTAAVYRHCTPAAQPRSSAALLKALADADLVEVGKNLFNRLQDPASKLSPWIDRLKSLFQRLDCLGHAMSGSGSSYFGVFRSRKLALRTAQYLQGQNLGAVFVASASGNAAPSDAGDRSEKIDPLLSGLGPSGVGIAVERKSSLAD